MASTSSTFDATAALANARSGALPEGWTKYTVVRALILTRTVTMLVFAVASLGFGGFLVRAESPLLAFQIVCGVVFGVIGLGLAALSAQGLQMLRRLDDYFFLITPQGFVQLKGAKVVALPLTDLAKVKMVRDLFTVSLVITKRSGEIIKVSGLRDYGEPTHVTRRLIDACSALYPSAQAAAKAEAN